MIFSNLSGWMTEEILLKWFTKLWSTVKLSDSVQPVLIFDHCPVHKKKIIFATIERKGAKYFLIPPGCTGYLQPLDVSINKPFKDKIRAMYKDWVQDESLSSNNVTKQSNIKTPSNDLMIDWVLKSLAEINASMIKKSFKTCGTLYFFDLFMYY